MKTRALRMALLLAVMLACGACHAQPAATAEIEAEPVRRIGAMASARAAHQATRLPSGKVLITGGCTGECDATLDAVEVFDPHTSTFAAAASMTVGRNSHAAIALADGRVVVFGGWSGSVATASVEIFDPTAGTFSVLPDMTQARAVPQAALLADGRVLITGGQTSAMAPIASAELFDPVAQQFAETGSMQVSRIAHTATSLADGRVLVAGGLQARRGAVLRAAEIYDPASETFTPTGDMSAPRFKHAAVRLGDGRVLMIGGAGVDDRAQRYRSTEIFDPATGTFAPGPDMQSQRYKLPDAAVLLLSGEVLVAGGAERPERYEPGANRFVALRGALDGAQEFATVTLLHDGSVLVAGGYDEYIRTSAASWRVRLSD